MATPFRLFTASDMKTGKKLKNTTYDIALTGVAIALIEVCKVTLMGLPNIELTSFWIIMFTLIFGSKILFVIPAFILIEGCMFGFGVWWVMYLYAWPLLALFTWIFRKQEHVLFWSVLSGFYGLFLDFCALYPMWSTAPSAEESAPASMPDLPGGWLVFPMICCTAEEILF